MSRATDVVDAQIEAYRVKDVERFLSHYADDASVVLFDGTPMFNPETQVSAPVQCRWPAFMRVAHVLHIFCICREWGCPVSPARARVSRSGARRLPGGNCDSWR
jgi:ketosteroid isomerase-like protein